MYLKGQGAGRAAGPFAWEGGGKGGGIRATKIEAVQPMYSSEQLCIPAEQLGLGRCVSRTNTSRHMLIGFDLNLIDPV